MDPTRGGTIPTFGNKSYMGKPKDSKGKWRSHDIYPLDLSRLDFDSPSIEIYAEKRTQP